MQGRNRNTDAENKRMDTKGGRGGGMNWEVGINIYTLMCMECIANEGLLYGTGNATSLCCAVETNTTL